MRLGTIIAIAALGMAMTPGAVTPADAGDKKKQAHQQGSKKKVHINPNVSTKNLQLLQEKLGGRKLTKQQHDLKRAVDEEVAYRRVIDTLAEGLSNRRGADAILGIGGLGTALGTRRSSGH